MKSERGVTLLELMVVMAIFLIVVTATLAFLSTHAKRTSQEIAKTKITQEGMISELMLVRDIAMAGMGVPTEFNGQFVPISSSDNTGQNGSDELSIKGAGISSGNYDYFKWGYNLDYIDSSSTTITISVLPEPGNPAYPSEVQTLFTLGWETGRANYHHPFQEGDKIVFLDAETKGLLSNNIYTINNVTADTITISPAPDFSKTEKGAFIFSLGGISATNFTDYMNRFTGYKLSTVTQPFCASGTYSLLRVYGASMPALDCVLDFQLQFGLVSSNGNITWVNDISGYATSLLKEQLKLVRVFIVKQYGKKDNLYNYPNTSITTADNTINLTSEQRHYHWRTMSLDIPLRELE